MGSKKLSVWLPLLFSIVMITGMFIGYNLRENISGGVSFLKNDKTNSLQEVIDLIRSKYVDPVSTDSIKADAINDLLAHLDPHSVYIPASELQEVNEDMQGNFQGIGIEFQIFNDTVNVVNVITGGPSFKAGVQIGDQIIKVNDSVLLTGKNVSLDDIRKYLRGPGGSSVKIIVLRNGELKNITIQRGTILLPSVDVDYMIAPQTGFIRINKFSETTYEEFMAALQSLQKQGMQKLILDLRGNGGGLVNEATDIADEFLDDNKMIVYTKGANTPSAEYRSKKDGLFEKGKLVVLVDETTASASEILAGALQDWDRATLIGRRTFGKGLVQQQFDLSDGAALRLTIARYYTPLGRNIQKPYDKGKEQYEGELINRFHDGEVVVGDTAKPKGPAFKTPDGHLVYGGGGITPDIFVAFDTTAQPQSVVQLYLKGTLNDYVYNYYKQNKSTLQTIKSPVDLTKQFIPGDKEWQQLNYYAKKDSVNLDTIPAKAKANLLKQLQALTARQIWRTEGFFEVENLTDPIVKKALDVLK
ncbi:MAG: S41 family peptidase [Chitinophagaceae bacterium]